MKILSRQVKSYIIFLLIFPLGIGSHFHCLSIVGSTGSLCDMAINGEDNFVLQGASSCGVTKEKTLDNQTVYCHKCSPNIDAQCALQILSYNSKSHEVCDSGLYQICATCTR